MVGVGIWAEYELDQDILQSFKSARNATEIMGDLRNTVGHQWPGRSSVGGVTSQYSVGGGTSQYSVGGVTSQYSVGGGTSRYSRMYIWFCKSGRVICPPS